MQLTLYMLRRDLPGDQTGFRESAGKFELIPNRGVGALIDLELRIHQSEPEPPLWQRDLLSIADFGDLRSLLNRRTGALLTFSYRSYRFVLTYGLGWHSVDPTALEPGFGLRVVANTVAADKIRSADTAGMNGRRRTQRAALASAGPLYELGIEPSESLVRQLEGTPAADFASQAAGSDALKLRVKDFALTHLESKLDQIIDKFEADDYKAQYEFLDHFRRIHRSESDTYMSLQELLVERIRSRDISVEFVPPDILEPLSVDYYMLEASNHTPAKLDEMSSARVGDLLAVWQLDDPLKDVTVRAYTSAGFEVVSPHPLFHYIASEVTLHRKRYALSAGQWYLVDADYLEAVSRRVDAIDDISDTLRLEPWKAGEDEGDYNARIAQIRGWQLLDKKNYSFGGYQRIEICDLLTPNKQLLCVKRMTQSSTLSHLFAQGSVSGQLLVSDLEKYKGKVVATLQAMRPEGVFGGREDWTIVFAIGTTKPGPLSKSLFFFSRLNLDTMPFR